MIFITNKHEKVLQVNDYTTSFITVDLSKDSDPITSVEVEPVTGYGFIDITGDDGFGWAYDVDGAVTMSVRVTAGADVKTVMYDIAVITEDQDRLFSSDNDLVEHEDDILGYLREGKRTFLDRHRKAQEYIMDTLDSKKITDVNGDKLTKFAIADLDEVKKWSTFMTLALIFEGLSNQIGDIFAEKAAGYREMAEKQSGRAQLRLDLDGDDTVEGQAVRLDLTSGTLVRR